MRANDWAVVIGVNEYRTPAHRLGAAVNDAAAMARWLLVHGGVPAEQLSLHLAGVPAAPPPVLAAPADRSSIIDGIERLLERSGGIGDRFYFYFAGHGLSSSVNGELQSAVLPSDFRAAETDRSFTLASVFALLASTDFQEQYFFIDACRNLAFQTDAVLGRYPQPRGARTPPLPQFVMYATQPGVQAHEILQPNDEHGAYTRALLEGLAGAGAAKRWDDQRGEYTVRWDSLFGYVEARVAAQKLQGGAGLVQVPQQYGERGGQNPVLARVPEEQVAPLRLWVSVSPAAALGRAHLVVSDLFGTVQTVAPPLPAPAPLDLMPRTYGLRSVAAGFRPLQPRVRLDLYASSTVQIGFVPDPTASVTGGAAPMIFHVAEPGSALGSVELSARDPLAALELATAAGQLLATGRGLLRRDGLAAGFYRASLLAPEGSRQERLFEVSGPATELIQLVPPPPAETPTMRWALARGGFDQGADGVVEPSEAVGPAYFLKLSTLLALAVGAASEVQQFYGARLRQLEIPGFDALVGRGPVESDSGGVYLIAGDDAAQGAAPARLWRDALLACDLSDDPGTPPAAQTRLRLHAKAPGIAYAALPLPAGTYGLRLQAPAALGMTLPVAVMPGWMALVVLTREAGLGFEIHHYQLPLRGSAQASPLRLERAAFATLRRAEQMQRLVQAGRLQPTLPDLELLLYDKWRDPVAGCLGAYLLHRMGRHDRLPQAVANLVRHFPALPDVHVLAALLAERRGFPVQARRAIDEAVRHGLPVFRDGLAGLVAAAARLGHAGLPAAASHWLAQVPEGALFSAVLSGPRRA